MGAMVEALSRLMARTTSSCLVEPTRLICRSVTLEKLPGLSFIEGSTRRDKRKMFPRKGTRELRSQRSEKLRESRLSELLRNRRNRLPPRRLQTLLTRKPRRPRQSRMFRNLLLESEERDKCDIIGYKHRCKLICLQ